MGIILSILGAHEAAIQHFDEAKIINPELPQPEEVVADAGYGFKEVYEYLEDRHINAYVQYPSSHAEKSGESKYRFHYSRFVYDEENDEFICPLGQRLSFIEERERMTKSGFMGHVRDYRCFSCGECPHKEACTKSSEGRKLTVNMNLRRHQQKARSNLEGTYGEGLRKRRGHEIETVFGEWKHNLKFRRFQLRGLDKVRAELILHSLAYNMRKIMKICRSFPTSLCHSFAHLYRILKIKSALIISFSLYLNCSLDYG